MKKGRNRMISILCTMALFFTMNVLPAYAEETPEAIATDALSDIQPQNLLEAEDASAEELENIIQQSGVKSSEAVLQETAGMDYNISGGEEMGSISSNNARSADSLTQQFTDVIAEENGFKYLLFSLEKDQIVNASMICPVNEGLNYDLFLCTFAEDGSLTPIKASNLGTYIDPDTGKTVDEAISYVHNQDDAADYAILVMATEGYSETDSFTLTISFDVLGSYDGNEPNDSAFEATVLSGMSADGSLHVVNDQDWYAVKITEGVYHVTAGEYQAEVYYAVEGNKMVRATKTEQDNYVLGSGTYYVRVYSDAAAEEFAYGNYTLQMEDQSKYASMQTAFDYGAWEYAYNKSPNVIPLGQQQAYYKFSIDSSDRAYASLMLPSGNVSGSLIEILNSAGTTVNYGFTGNSDLEARGVITKKNGLKYLVADINGSSVGTVGYIRITKVDPFDVTSSSIPFIDKRIYTGSGTYKFSGTAQNSGNGYSTVLTLNLTNNPEIPEGATVKSANTTGTMSTNVGGVQHMLNPGGAGWLASSATNGRASFDFSPYNIGVKNLWQFKYYQSAYSSTRLSNLSMRINWEYDIRNTNYELFY